MRERAVNPQQPAHIHERTDVSAKLIAWSIGGIALAAVITQFLMAGLFSYFEHHQETGPTVSPFAGARELPPVPRLQVGPQSELREFRQVETDKIDKYKWIDKNTGTVQIPVDRAIDLLVQRGIAPVPKQPATAQPFGAQPSKPAGPIGGGGTSYATPRQ